MTPPNMPVLSKGAVWLLNMQALRQVFLAASVTVEV
jgi:hypothetical protein